MHVGLGLNLGVGLGVGRASAPAYAHNRVIFDGADYLTSSTTSISAAGTFTMVFVVNPTDLGSINTLASIPAAGGIPIIHIASTGAITVSTPRSNADFGSGFFSAVTAAGVVTEDAAHVIVFRCNKTGTVAELYVNGVLVPFSATAPSWIGAGDFTVPPTWRIGSANTGGTLTFIGGMGLVWFKMGQFMNPASFYPEKALGASGQVDGVTPDFAFGGTQTAADWNAGTNLGSGVGGWTVTPAAGIG